MDCPLPIDWLDEIERGISPAAEEHLASCPACAAKVDALRVDLSPVGFGRWMSEIDTSEIDRITYREVSDIQVGQIWFSSHSFASVWGSYEDVDAIPLLILGPALVDEVSQWYDVAPLWVEPSDASGVDVVLDAAETTFDRPWALMFTFQTVVSADQLAGCAGHLTERGMHLLESVIVGNVDDDRFGFALEGADDLRLEHVRPLQAAISCIAQIYEAFLEQSRTETAKAATTGTSFGGAGSEVGVAFALAAASSTAKASPSHYVLNYGGASLEGNLLYDVAAGLLIFDVARAEVFQRRVCLVVESSRLKHPLRSGPFAPSAGVRVDLPSPVAISHWDVDRVTLEGADE